MTLEEFLPFTMLTTQVNLNAQPVKVRMMMLSIAENLLLDLILPLIGRLDPLEPSSRQHDGRQFGQHAMAFLLKISQKKNPDKYRRYR
jgi:hypothetical protein